VHKLAFNVVCKLAFNVVFKLVFSTAVELVFMFANIALNFYGDIFYIRIYLLLIKKYSTDNIISLGLIIELAPKRKGIVNPF